MAAVDVLVLGNGGRESAMVEQLAASPAVGNIYVAPGNAGTALLPRTSNVDVDPLSPAAVTAFVAEQHIGAVVIGPEAPLVHGVSDALRDAKVPVFGPSRQAAQLEASKAFAADFMRRHDIPQPPSIVVNSPEEGLAAIQGKAPNTYVIKADGLAAGKGVILPATTAEAETTLHSMFAGDYGEAGKHKVVIQERFHGPEVSAFAISDGTHLVLLPLAQDHKRLQNHDKGPNTGGMGAYCPVPASIVSPAQAAKISDIAQRTIDGMRADGTPYQGVLYLGLMLAEELGGDPIVIEYNARFGDPETEVVLAVLRAAGMDVGDMLLHAARGDITNIVVPKIAHTALTVCLAADGYGTSDSPRKNDLIHGLGDTYPNVTIHQAGTKQAGKDIVTNGGRVLYVTATGRNADDAATNAYKAIGTNGIHFNGMQYRTDIGHQARS